MYESIKLNIGKMNPGPDARATRRMLLFIVAVAACICATARAEEKPVSYFHDVRPIFNSNCNACHKPEKNKGELDMTTFANLMKGGKHGSAVVPEHPEKSKIIEMISGDEPDMPKDTDPLHKEQIAIIE